MEIPLQAWFLPSGPFLSFKIYFSCPQEIIKSCFTFNQIISWKSLIFFSIKKIDILGAFKVDFHCKIVLMDVF